MPEITSCPDCEKKLRVPDDLIGKKVRCPGCSVMFLAQAGAGLPEEAPKAAARASAPRNEAFSERRSDARDEDEDERPRGRRRQEEDEDAEEERSRSRRGRNDDDQRIRTRPDEEDDRRRRSRRDEEDEDYPDRRRRDEDEDDRPRNAGKGWRGVRMGLTLVMIAGWVALGMVGIGAIGLGILMLTGGSLIGMIFNAAPNQMGGTAAGGAVAMGIGLGLFLLVIGLMVLAELVLRITGYGLCMQVPASRRNSARGLAIASFSCAAAALFLNFAGGFMNGFGGFGRGGLALAMTGSGNIMGNFAGLVALAGFICWLLFLRTVALELRAPEVAQRVVQYIITTLVFGGVAFLLIIILAVVGVASTVGAAGASSLGGALGAMGAFGVFAFLVIGLICLGSLGLYVWYILIVTQVRGLVARHLARM